MAGDGHPQGVVGIDGMVCSMLWVIHPALALLLGLNGTRIGETCAIDIDDIDTNGKHVTVRLRHRKTNGDDTISVAARTARAITRSASGRTSGPLLLGPRGGRLTPKRARTILRGLADQIHMPTRITPRSYRNGFVVRSIDAGAPVRDIMGGTGHVDPGMIAYYDVARNGVEHNSTHLLAAWIDDTPLRPVFVVARSARRRKPSRATVHKPVVPLALRNWVANSPRRDWAESNSDG